MHKYSRSFGLTGALAPTFALLACARVPAQPVQNATKPAQSAPASTSGYVWFEAENPTKTNFPPADANPFKPANDKEANVLSGGRWIGTSSDRSETLFAEYSVTVPTDGTYQFFARKFWKHGPYRWRFDNGVWQSVGADVSVMDGADLRQFVGANWTSGGEVSLTKGAHTLRIELAENKGAAAFDCFLLTRQPFVARGKLKPNEKYNHAPEGWFAWEPDTDTFAPSPIDLRRLNEKFAGEGGFIQVREDGFVHEKTGKPVRFWAVNVGGETVNLDKASIDYMARSLAKEGVNLVRIHGPVWQGDDIRAVDKTHLERLQYFVSALKREGIYTSLSIYFPLWLDMKDSMGFAGYGNGKKPFALLFFNPDFQQIYRDWWKAVLTTPNPYADNRPLGLDPALAMTEMVNEDSFLFWTFTPYEAVPAPQMEILEKQFGDWLAQKYGSLNNAFAAWANQGSARGDDQKNGRAGFLPLYEIFSKKNQRAQDTASFLADRQRSFFDETRTYLKNTLGYRGSVYASNWTTADARTLGPLEKWSNASADFLDRHGYFGGRHEGERASYSLSNGDKFENRSALLFSPDKPGDAPNFSLPLWDIEYNNKPSTITEVNWTPPNRFRADQPFLAATYGSLQGTDALFFFATGSPSWEQTLAKFPVRTPVTAGQFPAAALVYRLGYVKPAATVVEANLPIADIRALKGAPLSAPQNLDEFRAKDIPVGQAAPVQNLSTLDPLAFCVGRVAVNFTDVSKPSRSVDLTRYIDRNAQVARSQTGELAWNWKDGRAVLIAPKATGATGFLGRAGSISLKDVTVETPLEYGTVLLVSLDDKPLAESGRMLLQVMSEENNDGYEVSAPDDKGLQTIKDIGHAPLVVKQIAGTVLLRRADAAGLKVTALDANGYPAGMVGTGKRIALRPNTVYYLIEK